MRTLLALAGLTMLAAACGDDSNATSTRPCSEVAEPGRATEDVIADTATAGSNICTIGDGENVILVEIYCSDGRTLHSFGGVGHGYDGGVWQQGDPESC